MLEETSRNTLRVLQHLVSGSSELCPPKRPMLLLGFKVEWFGQRLVVLLCSVEGVCVVGRLAQVLVPYQVAPVTGQHIVPRWLAARNTCAQRDGSLTCLAIHRRPLLEFTQTSECAATTPTQQLHRCDLHVTTYGCTHVVCGIHNVDDDNLIAIICSNQHTTSACLPLLLPTHSSDIILQHARLTQTCTHSHSVSL